jgi:sulfatase maturation enzyme AslB (radical SAM superfamily)
MQCPRLDHFVRFNPNGTVSRCGHMINTPQFDSLQEMDESLWLRNVKLYMHKGFWPVECTRCKQSESINEQSIRLNAIQFDRLQRKSDYLIVGGVLDNICNSGCLTCDENHSTKIGSLKSKTYQIVDNTNRFWQLPVDRITHLDINGGEPSASKNYRAVLKNLPVNVQSVRINTNCSTVIPEIDELIDKGVKVTVTVSLDGIEEVHDQVRWPIKWDKFYENLMIYKNKNQIDLNTWTTVSALNIHNFTAIKQFTANNQLAHSYAFLHNPDVLNIRYQNDLTIPHQHVFPSVVAVDRNNQTELDAFILQQKELRGL